MVKLTPDLIQQSMQYINPVRDRELDLRGNIGVDSNLYNSIDAYSQQGL
jgi:U2 small nuclear ribonucleoprotein A'